MPTQAEKARAFRALHERPGAFMIPNPWDAGSARLLAQLGFEALATTSAGFAFTLGQADGTVSREQALEHSAAIAAATPLPVSGDLENGFGDSPEEVAETIRLAAAAGLAGCSIEDRSRAAEGLIYEKELAVERVRAGAEAARRHSFPFTLTARCENFLAGREDLSDTIDRLQAYQEAGADVLYAPGVSSRADLAAIVHATGRPINALATGSLSLDELSSTGVKRVSVGSALARVAFGAFLRAANGMRESGGFHFPDAINYREINRRFLDLA
jgi:2-methylisocitrate lyase-like PEP mutase family enzyme